MYGTIEFYTCRAGRDLKRSNPSLRAEAGDKGTTTYTIFSPTNLGKKTSNNNVNLTDMGVPGGRCNYLSRLTISMVTLLCIRTNGLVGTLPATCSFHPVNNPQVSMNPLMGIG